MRWLANHYGKQKERMKFKSSDRQTKWQRWPQHIAAPTKTDMRTFNALYKTIDVLGTMYHLGGGAKIIVHATFVWYNDGTHYMCFAGVLFPDGTEWWPLHDTEST